MNRAAFQKTFELKKTGLQIYKYTCWENDKAECLGRGVSPKKDYIILDNTSENELRRPDFIKELCQYKTRCEYCKMILRRVLKLLEAVDEIKKREVVGVCEHCKRRNRIACKRCNYLIEKYLEQRKALEKESLFKHWLEELQHIFEPLASDEIKMPKESRLWSGKELPKEFRYPPSRELFPDHGTPVLSKYPQSRELSEVKKDLPIFDDSYYEKKMTHSKYKQARDSEGMQSPVTKGKVAAKVYSRAKVNEREYDRDPLISLNSSLHAPLMRGPSEFPNNTDNYRKMHYLTTKSTDERSHGIALIKGHVGTIHDEVEQDSPREVRRLRAPNIYGSDVSPIKGQLKQPKEPQYAKMSPQKADRQFVEGRSREHDKAPNSYKKERLDISGILSPDTKRHNLQNRNFISMKKLENTFHERIEMTSPSTKQRSLLEKSTLRTKAQSITTTKQKKVPGEQRDAYNLISEDKTTRPQNSLAKNKHHTISIKPKTVPLIGKNSSPDKPRPKKDEKLPFISDQTKPKELWTAKKDQLVYGEIAKTHEQSRKIETINKSIITNKNILSEKKVHGTSKKKIDVYAIEGISADLQGQHNIKHIKSVSEFMGLQKLGEKKIKTQKQKDAPGKVLGKSMPDAIKKTDFSKTIDDISGKDPKTSLDHQEAKDFTLKSIMQKKRKRDSDENRMVSLKIQKDENLNKQHKNLHKLDIKLEKIIYEKFVARMQKIQQMKEKRKAELREQRKLNMSKSKQSKIDIRERKKTRSGNVKSNANTWYVDIDSDVEDEESPSAAIFKETFEQTVSVTDSNPVVCPIEEVPNVKIEGNKIVKLKEKGSHVLLVFKTADLQSLSSKVNYNPPILYWDNPVSECATPVLDDKIMRYELSNRIWIEHGWTLLPKQVVVKEISLYEMVPLQDTWFLMHKHQTLFYRTGEKLAVIDEEGNGKVFYKNGKLAIQHNVNKELSTERVVVYSSGEGLLKLSPRRRVRKLAVFDHLGSGVVFDGNGRTRLKYNQLEGEIIDAAIKGKLHWKFHNLNKKPIVKTIYEETVEPLGSNESIANNTESKKNKAATEIPPEPKESMLAIEKENKLKTLKTTEYDLYSCNIGPFFLSRHFKIQIKDQRDIILHFLDAAGVRLNLGMKMISTSLIGYILTKEREIATPLDKHIHIQYY